jgi:acetolactate decarboxylase
MIRFEFRKYLFVLLIFLLGCSGEKEEEKSQAVIQVSTIDALMTGVYDGITTLSDLTEWGNFGIGTFNALNGEMVFFDGVFYQVKADGKIYRPADTTKTPFATVTFFEPESRYNLAGLSFPELKLMIDSLIPSANLFYAIHAKGTFTSIKTRSVPAQEKPYPQLVDVAAKQPEFETGPVRGNLLGFYGPPFVSGMNVPGYHLHFISDDLQFGGHVLEFELSEGVLAIDQINQFRLICPDDDDFLDADLTGDMSEELEEVEGN